MTVELIQMPKHAEDRRSVRRFYPFEEHGRRLLVVVESAAFAELDDVGWAVAHAVVGRPRVTRSEVVEALAGRFSPEVVEETLDAFEQLEILVSPEMPVAPVDRIALAEPLGSLVLHVSHDCNMRCGYCYADFGRYGGDAGIMDPELAVAHTRRFFDQLGPGRRVTMTFFGGEPLMNMPVVYAAHAYAKERAEAEGRKVSFGLTTNGTLLSPEIADFLRRERFAVTVSIDGPPDVNDRLRPLQDGEDSYELIVERVRASGLDAHARVTLTRRCLDVARIVRHLAEVGFREVGVSPVATGLARFDLDGDDLNRLLEELHVLADDFVAYAREGRLFPFSNLRTLLEQIAAGEPRGVPCGAGTRLVAADNQGDWYACHRLVGQDAFRIGSVADGVDTERRTALLTEMHPRSRAPCQTCWARYLCGGGCHHIAWLHSERGEAPWEIDGAFCDFLRAWYRLGLHTYARLLDEAPAVLARLGASRSATGCNQPQGQ